MIESRHPRLNQNEWTTAVSLRQTAVITLCFSFCEDIKILQVELVYKDRTSQRLVQLNILHWYGLFEPSPKQEPL
jgi:hypothetical protein